MRRVEASDAHPGDPPALSHREILTIFAGLMIGLFLAALDQTIVATALPKVVGELGGVDQLSWVVVGYMLTSTAVTPLWGKISDLFGRRPTFLTAILVFLGGSFLCGAAQNMIQLVLFRGIQGIGGGGLFALAFAIVGDVVAPRERGRYMGYFTAVFSTASVAGPLLGGFFVDHFSWRWIFYVNLPFGVAAVAVVWVKLRLPHTKREHKIDFLGAGLLVAAVSCIVLLTTWAGGSHSWASPRILGTGAAGLVLTVAFVLWERRAVEPILPLELFRIPTLAVTLPVSFLAGSVMFGSTVFLPLFLQGSLGISASASGFTSAPMMLVMSATSIVVGRKMSQTGRYKWAILAGFVVLIVPAAVFTQLLTPATSRWWVMAVLLVQGLGIGLSMPTMSLATQNAAPMQHMGTATAALTFFRSLGGSLGVALYGAVLTNHLAGQLADVGDRFPMPEGIVASKLADNPTTIVDLAEPLRSAVRDALAGSVRSVFWVVIPVVLIGLALSFRLPELPLRSAKDPKAAAAADLARAEAAAG